MNGLNFIAVLRTITYLWVAVEFSNLTYLYFVGYRDMKTTPIIKSLQIMFFFLSLLVFVLAFLPILLEFDKEAHYFMVSLLPFFIIPVGIASSRFRAESLRKQTMELPDHRKITEKKDV